MARAQGLALSAQEADRMAKSLRSLEADFRPLTTALPPELEPAFEFHMEDE